MNRACSFGLGGCVALVLVCSAWAAEEGTAPANPYNGTQMREEVFEFAEKPSVRTVDRHGHVRYEIAFASKAACDATVAILDKGGKIVRHLASGVLGKNAPWPFQQNSLAQRIEWDGKDDAGNPAPAGCVVRVSLGLRAKFEQNIGYDPLEIPVGTGGSQLAEVRKSVEAGAAYVVAKGKDGEVYVLGAPGHAAYQGRVFKDGKYVRTFWPASAEDAPKLAPHGYRFATTHWGDKVFVAERYGPAGPSVRDPRQMKLEDITAVMFKLAGISDQKLGPLPEGLPKSALPAGFSNYFDSKQHRMAVDRVRDELYLSPARGLMRVDGKTGKVDDTWFPDGSLHGVSEVCVGPDGNVYVSTGAHFYGQFITRLSRDGKVLNFAGDAVPIPKGAKWEGGGGQYGAMEGQGIYGGSVCPPALRKMGDVRSLWTGHFGHSNTHERGMYVSPKGYILHAVQHPWAERFLKHGGSETAPRRPGTGGEIILTSYVNVWDANGKLLTADAVGDMQNGHGVAMDADGNIYAAMGGRVPADQKNYWGTVDRPLSGSFDQGSLVKFRGGKPYPLGKAYYGADAPAGLVKLTGYRSGLKAIEGPEWILGVLMSQSPDICTCHNVRYDMDYFARHWLPANQLFSVVVLDANGNCIARLGRYGNVDDTEEDLKAERDGLRFVWMRAIAVSDSALYVADTGSRRILKAALAYAVEETLPLP